MKSLILCLILGFALGLVAQDTGEGGKPTEKPAEDSAPSAADVAREDEEQRAIRAVSLRELENADERLNKEREAIVKSERRINSLLEDLNNRTADIETKTENLQALLDESAKEDTGAVADVPAVQIDHWNSRNPAVAAKDFVILYQEEPQVAIGIIKGMKKKKSAALIDAVSALNNNGKVVAAKLHESIGSGQ